MNNSSIATNITNPNNGTSSNNDVQFAILCIFCLALLLTLVTSTLTIVVMARTPALRTCTNAFIVSLSVSDIFFSLVLLAIVVLLVVRRFVTFKVDPVAFQMVVYFAWGIQIHGSNGNLVLVSLERWFYITQPFLYQRYVTARGVVVTIGVMWVISFAVNIPYLCFSTDLYTPTSYFIISMAYVNPTIHTICCVILIVIYSHICFITYQHMSRISKLKRQTQRRGDDVDNINTLVSLNSEKSKLAIQIENWKSVRLLITICGIFFVLVSPYAYFTAYSLTKPSSVAVSSWLSYIFLLMLSLFHCSNFFVYALGIRLFKNAIKKQLRKWGCRGAQVSTQNGSTAVSAYDRPTRTQYISHIASYD